MAMIKEAYHIVSDNADVFASPSRLNTIPRAGLLTIEMSATVSDGSNYWLATMQTPEGATPFESLRVPFNGRSVDSDVLDDNMEMMFEFAAPQGGHFLLDVNEQGTSAIYIVATLVF